MTKKKTTKIEAVKEEPKKKFEMTAEVMDQLFNGTLTTEDKAVNYLIGQLISTRQQYDKVFPQLQQKEKELVQLRKALHEISTRFETLQMDICNLWPN